MLFNSLEFLIFAPIILIGHAFLNGRPLKVWLVIGSYIFYGWAKPWYCFLLFLSTVLDYSLGRALGKAEGEATRRLLLICSLVGNLGILAIFKYTGFFSDFINDFTRLTFPSLQVQLPVWSLPLPVGISFYTFQTLSYTIDVYRRKLTPTNSFLNFALYVAFFPQLVAGPIERATHLLNQLEHKMPRTEEDILVGNTRILVGFIKKLVLADWLAIYVDQVYAAHGTASNFELLLATYAFAFQIYLDFSAYSDIAIGLSRIMGIDIQENFQWPYLSRNISEFWRRWHISLSTWLRDYLYFPLGGSRRGILRTTLNVFLVMLLGGLWHGADYTFIAWGLWIGLALAVFQIYAYLFKIKFDITKPLQFKDTIGIFITFHVVLVSWVFFRSDSLFVAKDILGKMFLFWQGPWLQATADIQTMTTITVVGLSFLLHFLRRVEMIKLYDNISSPVKAGMLWAGLIFIVAIFHAPTSPTFIYFQF